MSRSGRRSTRSELGVLTGAKLVANAALRWVGPFLPTLERAFGASTGGLTTVLGLAELGGLSTAATGRLLDRGHRRRMFLGGLAGVAASSIIALAGTLAWFGVAFLVLVVGVSNLTVAGLAWISARVPYDRRGRAIGVFETSWALALLVGAPVIAVLVRVFGWRGPFVALAVAAVVAFVAVLALVSPDHTPAPEPRPTDGAGSALPPAAWAVLVASALTAAAGLGVFVVSGSWLTDRHGVSTGGLGAVAMGFGALELAASGGSAFAADRIGKRRSVALGLLVLGAGLLVTAGSGSSLAVAVAGLTLFLAGFEFAFVTSLSLVSEAAPHARGRAIGIGNAIGTVARASAVFVSGQLYDAVGIGGSLGLAAFCASVAGVLVAVGGRRRALAA